ncbi:MAG: hypothetical protein ABH858_06895 [Candidatus Omnitrophota bacterium]
MRVFLCIFLVFSFDAGAALFTKVEGIKQASIEMVYTNKFGANIVYAVSGNMVFKGTDEASQWQSLFVAKDSRVRDVYVDDSRDTIYVATIEAVYKISDQRTLKIFSLPPEIEARCIEKCDGEIFLGTSQGIYYCGEDSHHWKKIKRLPQDLSVSSIYCSGNNIYVASEDGVYVSSDKKSFSRKFVINKIESDSEEEGFLFSPIIKGDIFDKNCVYLGSWNGLYLSSDKGNTWQAFPLGGSDNACILDIIQSEFKKGLVYLATDRGVLAVDLINKDVSTLFEGLSSREVLSLDFDINGALYAATKRGLFIGKDAPFDRGLVDLKGLLDGEPSITEVQEAALRYNQVHPERIRKWRNSLKYRALFPTLSLDYDKTLTYDSGSDKYYTGPNDWGIGFSWDVADLIWNSYEDDVDTRGRLITQLRINILDDINTIYHERLRIKQELSGKSGGDEKERFKKELRLRELTAALDGYTGGYFSRRIRELTKKRP